MTPRRPHLAALLAPLLMLTPLPAAAEYLAPDWASLTIEGVNTPDWIAGPRDGAFIGMCVTCDGTMLLQVQVVPDDGTGGRVRSGETTAQTYDELGKANAARLGGDSAYYGTEELTFASAMGFKTQARAATGDYSATYQLWSDGQQLVVRVYGKDQSMVEKIGESAYRAAAPLTFR